MHEKILRRKQSEFSLLTSQSEADCLLRNYGLTKNDVQELTGKYIIVGKKIKICPECNAPIKYRRCHCKESEII
jgi:hypothetical protein